MSWNTTQGIAHNHLIQDIKRTPWYKQCFPTSIRVAQVARYKCSRQQNDKTIKQKIILKFNNIRLDGYHLEVFSKKIYNYINMTMFSINWQHVYGSEFLIFWMVAPWYGQPTVQAGSTNTHKSPSLVYGKQKQEISCSCIDQSHDHTKQRLPWFLQQQTETFTLH